MSTYVYLYICLDLLPMSTSGQGARQRCTTGKAATECHSICGTETRQHGTGRSTSQPRGTTWSAWDDRSKHAVLEWLRPTKTGWNLCMANKSCASLVWNTWWRDQPPTSQMKTLCSGSWVVVRKGAGKLQLLKMFGNLSRIIWTNYN